MAFIRMNGIEGLVYDPEDTGAVKKHACADCYRCQWCSDNRCELCLQGKSHGRKSPGPESIPLRSLHKRDRKP